MGAKNKNKKRQELIAFLDPRKKCPKSKERRLVFDFFEFWEFFSVVQKKRSTPQFFFFLFFAPIRNSLNLLSSLLFF